MTPPVKTPKVFLRDGHWVADLRRFGGSQYQALGLAGDADPVLVGYMLRGKVDELRLGARVMSPELPGLADEGMLMRELLTLYAEDHECPTAAGKFYTRKYCRQIAAQIGHMPVSALAAPAGRTVLLRWRDELWVKKLANKTVKNYLGMLKAALIWGQSGGRQLTGALPEWPKAIRDGEALSNPVFDHWSEQDFRHFRDHFGEASGARMWMRSDPADWIARRRLYLSFAYYTGMHAADLGKIRKDWLNVAAGRFWRHNQKSARCVDTEPFDMPAALVLDCEAELRRLGREWEPKELITGGPWPHTTDIFRCEIRRLFPAGGPRLTPCHLDTRVLRRSTAWELAIRGWQPGEISAYMGHVDDTMVRHVYLHCKELGLIADRRIPWALNSGPGGKPSGTARVYPLRAVK